MIDIGEIGLNFLIYLTNEFVRVPIAWIASDVEIGDTPFSILLRVVLLFLLTWFGLAPMLRDYITRPVALRWAKLRSKEFYNNGWKSLHGIVAIWCSLIIILSALAFMAKHHDPSDYLCSSYVDGRCD
jgi:hypothetical protein